MAAPRQEAVKSLTLLATTQSALQGRAGFSVEQLDAAINEAVNRASRFLQPAKVTLEFTFTPQGRDKMRVGAKIKVSAPEPKVLPIELFVDKTGRLVEDDPEQETFPFVPVKVIPRE